MTPFEYGIGVGTVMGAVGMLILVIMLSSAGRRETET